MHLAESGVQTAKLRHHRGLTFTRSGNALMRGPGTLVPARGLFVNPQAIMSRPSSIVAFDRLPVDESFSFKSMLEASRDVSVIC
jgi:hypothetical protein